MGKKKGRAWSLAVAAGAMIGALIGRSVVQYATGRPIFSWLTLVGALTAFVTVYVLARWLVDR